MLSHLSCFMQKWKVRYSVSSKSVKPLRNFLNVKDQTYFTVNLPFHPFGTSWYTVDRTPWTGDQPVARPLPTLRTTQTQNKHAQTSMPGVGL
jgi:hypothetical protein